MIRSPDRHLAEGRFGSGHRLKNDKNDEKQEVASNLKPHLYFLLIKSFLSQKSRLNLIFCIMSKGLAK